MFIKVASGADSGLILDSDGLLLPGGLFRESNGDTNWVEVRESDCCGVRVDDPRNKKLWGELYAWDVDTVVVWDPLCELILDSKIFRGLGSFHYNDGGLKMFDLLTKMYNKLLRL